MANEKKKDRADYMRKHRKDERKLIRIGKHFLNKYPELVEKELGRMAKLEIKPRPIHTSQIRIPQLELLPPSDKPKNKKVKKKRRRRN